MKNILFLLLFAITGSCVYAQTYYPVTHLSGTLNIACTDVTVTSAGDATYHTHCGPGPYLIGNIMPPPGVPDMGSYTWTFTPSVNAIRTNINAIDPGIEEISVWVNGIHIDFTNLTYATALSSYVSSCPGSPYPLPLVRTNGNLTGPGGVVPWADVTITLTAAIMGAPITSIQIICIGNPYGAGNGVSMEFEPSVTPVTMPPITGRTLMCTGSVTTLSNALTGGTWSSATPGVATINATTGVLTAVSPGTTVIRYTLPGGCSITTTVTVEDATSACSPCSGFTSPYTTLAGGTLSGSTVAPGNYYLTGDVTITGNVAGTDVVLLLDPGLHIYVDPYASLKLEGCRFFGCPGTMWAGIELRSDPWSTGKVSLLGNAAGMPTLIEDALIGVDVPNPVAPNGGGYFVNCNNAIFNRNNTGIRLINYTLATSTLTNPLEYELHVENTVFTSRTLVAGATWPKTTGPAGLKATYTTAAYVTPYKVTQYPTENCHNYAGGTGPRSIGIELNNVGKRIGAVYTGVRIGQANTTTLSPPDPSNANLELNLFDNIAFGVKAVDANLTVHNSAFAVNPIAGPATTNVHDIGGDGIYAAMTNGERYKLSVEPAYYLYFSGSMLQTRQSVNNFYNCKYGVYALNYYLVTGAKSVMTTNQDNTTNTNSGNYGYDIQTKLHQLISLTDNTITNVANGISVKTLTGTSPTFSTQTPGQVTITNNKIRATPVSSAPPGIRYVRNAIWVDNAINYILAMPAGFSFTQVNTDDNVLENVYNGIYINGIQAQAATSDRNKISTVMHSGTTGPDQYAIYHANCLDDGAIENTISGTDYTKDKWWGIKVAGSTGHMVGCNNVTNVGRGFEFENTTITSNWINNDVTNAQKGLVLNSSSIGVQGGTNILAGNRWLKSGTVFNWTGSNYNTYTINSNPTNSTLWTSNAAPYKPLNNGTLISPSLKYSVGNGLIIATATAKIGALCSPYILPIFMLRNQLLHFTLRQELKNTLHAAEQNWMGQYTAWQVLARHTILADPSGVTNAFKKMAADSRYGLMTKIENDLALGDADGAASLLATYGLNDLATTDSDKATGVVMADDTTANRIVANYRHFYEIYINYEKGKTTAADSTDIEAMAMLCPLTDGGAVYKARALYDILYDTLRLFTSPCDTATDTATTPRDLAQEQDGGSIKSVTNINDITGQKYLLYPNPNDGNFIMQQVMVDNAPVVIEVWDAAGRSIYKEELIFSGAKAKLQLLNKVPGIYLLQLTDDAGRKFRFKFVVE